MRHARRPLLQQLVAVLCLCDLPGLGEARGQWTAERARAWHASQPWRLGANYLPSTCSNVLEMFEPSTFETTLLVVEREAALARAIGMTTLRIFLHEELYHAHGEAFLDQLDRLFGILSRRGLVVMPVLFDAVWRPDAEGASPLPGVHNSAWVQCPTHTLLREYAAGSAGARERLSRYVSRVVSRFAADARVACWDVYNEASSAASEHHILPRLATAHDWAGAPEHWLLDGEKQEATLQLLADAFRWARQADPQQPLTSAVWTFPEDANGPGLDGLHFRTPLALSDVVSLHCYCEPEELEVRLAELGALGRPVLLTEFMARPLNSCIEGSLPLLRRAGAWGYVWGLVRGRSQTDRPWSSWFEPVAGEEEDGRWFHDLFYENGTAYDEGEVKEVWWQAVGRDLGL
mmetsp:Transcript_123410/g.384076  ORF Transcript_123410/g.384076 Transcript_123410/m.384076 type:complete len:404 (-) Transcript_123410:30-1241(-)